MLLRRLYVNLKKSSFDRTLVDTLLVKLLMLSPLHVSTPTSIFPAHRLVNYRLDKPIYP